MLLFELFTFIDIKTEIRKEYNHSWLKSVFKFDINTVKFEKISSEDLRFLKCEYTLLALYLLDRIRL